jgi:hypothetical protein
LIVPNRTRLAFWPVIATLACDSAWKKGSPRFLVHPDAIEATKIPI